ncbi:MULTISPECIES: hypothetical protein [Citrobacter]|uniref:Uncharacterized protein n=1 Tax=Myoviridae sp. ctnhb8 TaxID=2825171 RepID=A0A8S5VE70_9CAUD|nr:MULTISPECIES: hypothetical protein [Citrobacter]TKV09295.1 hypothetical protein FDX19_12780 [Citrobacter sp. wls619]DAG04976.1 MAG TPA: hypothetical protein [Myoviridae sp. ctnhb8]
MAENTKGSVKQIVNNPPTIEDKKSHQVYTPSEPIRYDSSIPVPGSKVVTESYQPPLSKKGK